MTESSEWIGLEPTYPFAWGIFVGGPTLTVLLGLSLVYLSGGPDSLGGWGVVTLILVAVVGGGAGFDVWFFDQFAAKAIRLSGSGVEVRTLFGRIVSIPWTDATLSDGRWGSGSVRSTSPFPRTRSLSPRQYSAAKTFPLRVG
jgi:hypothetical protein